LQVTTQTTSQYTAEVAFPNLVFNQPDVAYIYGDYGSGKIWALRHNGTAANTLLVDSGLIIASFGVDQNGELFSLLMAAKSIG
jgi:hypothetical protein